MSYRITIEATDMTDVPAEIMANFPMVSECDGFILVTHESIDGKDGINTLMCHLNLEQLATAMNGHDTLKMLPVAMKWVEQKQKLRDELKGMVQND